MDLMVAKKLYKNSSRWKSQMEDDRFVIKSTSFHGLFFYLKMDRNET